MFKVDNELENANVPRTIRFTESLFERVDEAAGQKIIRVLSVNPA